MTKFKVGDKVTLYGEVVEVSNTDVRHGISVLLDGRDDREDGDEYPVYVNEGEIAYVKEGHVTDTTFRDKAAIAALQAMLINTNVSPGGDARAMAKSSFELAEALDAERTKRDGGE